MDPQCERETALVETVLFLESEPIGPAAIAKATGLAPEAVEDALVALGRMYAHPGHGLEPVEQANGWILSPKLSLWNDLKERYGRKNESRLSSAAMQTLSIVAYSQPVTRAEIEDIRGVSADGMIRQLLDRGFIREVGRKEAPGRPVQFGTTTDFLKHFRLGSIADLPRLGDPDRERFEEDPDV